jgi:ABC-type multidrug transport system fused ATPase/permease subunit
MTTFYRLLGFLRPYKRGMIISWTLASLAMVMTVALPALTGRAVQIIGTAPQHHHGAAQASARHELTLIAGAIALLVLARWGFMYWRRMVAGRLSLGVEYDLRKLLYGHLQQLELGFFDRQQTGQLMSCASSSATGSCSSCSRSSRSCSREP